MPDTVNSGVPFDAGASAAAIGVENVHDGVVTITLPAPLRITGVTASPGTSATFSNAGLATVTWTLHTLDSNTRSTLTIHAMAALPPGVDDQLLTAQASMVADGIGFGELVANDSFVLERLGALKMAVLSPPRMASGLLLRAPPAVVPVRTQEVSQCG